MNRMHRKVMAMSGVLMLLTAICAGCSEKQAEPLTPEGTPNPNVPNASMGGVSAAPGAKPAGGAAAPAPPGPASAKGATTN